jgi:RNA polymerase sigma-70 factor (ECF subfamily)
VYSHQVDDRSVFETYRDYGPAVYARCVRILRDREGARDVTQEVFVRCHKERARLRPGRELLPWLYQVATNLCLNALRHEKVRAAASRPDGIAREFAPEGPSRRFVIELLDGLDARTQLLVVYVYLDGMTQAEAAAVAGVSDRTVRKCLARFLRHGRRALGLAEGEHDDESLSIRLQAR